MISVKEAVEIALRFADEVLGQAKLIDPRLEEVELEEGPTWRVTVSFVREPAKLTEVLAPPGREYKVLTVDAESGEVHSMKIRQPA
jgi:hypothetical protein